MHKMPLENMNIRNYTTISFSFNIHKWDRSWAILCFSNIFRLRNIVSLSGCLISRSRTQLLDLKIISESLKRILRRSRNNNKSPFEIKYCLAIWNNTTPFHCSWILLIFAETKLNFLVLKDKMNWIRYFHLVQPALHSIWH